LWTRATAATLVEAPNGMNASQRTNPPLPDQFRYGAINEARRVTERPRTDTAERRCRVTA